MLLVLYTFAESNCETDSLNRLLSHCYHPLLSFCDCIGGL